MFAVIKTGGKQYRVSPGDMLVVEKLDGAPGDELRFDQVLMMGEGDQITVGAPLIDGGLVRAVLVETRKGEKIKIFKKKRRQGYRRTGGHRQIESVLRVTGLEGAGQSAKWDGEVKLVTRQEMLARSRGLTPPTAAAQVRGSDVIPAGVHVDPVVTDETPGPVHHVSVVEHADPAPVDAAPAKKTRAKKAASDEGAFVEPPTSEVSADAPQTIQSETDAVGAQAGTETEPKKPRAPKKPKASPEGGES
jgi:large subunit ribosomal protein L21